MNFDNSNNSLTLYLTGRIDANNSAEIESEISGILDKNPGLVPVFDASELEYISSAGLRVLLKFRKAFAKNLDVLNASSEVYDIFEVTGFTELLNVKKKLREVSIEGCEIIGGGLFSTVYRLDSDTIVKVFNKIPVTLERIESDQQRAREIFIRDIPTAISFDVVKVGGYYGIVYEMIDAISLAGTLKQNPHRLPKLGRKMGALLKKLHTTEFATGTLPDGISSIYEAVNVLHSHGYISDSECDMLNGILDRIPKRNTLLHYDYHPNNILVQGDDLVLIDVGEASLGNPVIDFAFSYFFAFTTLKYMNATIDGIEQLIGINNAMMTDLWREMMAEYFGTTDAEKLRSYDEIIEGYSMLRGVFLSSNFIGRDNFEVKYKQHVLPKSIQYLTEHNLKSLEGVF